MLAFEDLVFHVRVLTVIFSCDLLHLLDVFLAVDTQDQRCLLIGQKHQNFIHAHELLEPLRHLRQRHDEIHNSGGVETLVDTDEVFGQWAYQIDPLGHPFLAVIHQEVIDNVLVSNVRIVAHPPVDKSFELERPSIVHAALLDGTSERLLKLYFGVSFELQLEVGLDAHLRVDGFGVKVLPGVVIVDCPGLKLVGNVGDHATRGASSYGGDLARTHCHVAVLIKGRGKEVVSVATAHLLDVLLQCTGPGDGDLKLRPLVVVMQHGHLIPAVEGSVCEQRREHGRLALQDFRGERLTTGINKGIR